MLGCHDKRCFTHALQGKKHFNVLYSMPNLQGRHQQLEMSRSCFAKFSSWCNNSFNHLICKGVWDISVTSEFTTSLSMTFTHTRQPASFTSYVKLPQPCFLQVIFHNAVVLPDTCKQASTCQIRRVPFDLDSNELVHRSSPAV